jgi:hypothetical protein
MPDDYRNVRRTAVTIASGRPLAPGEAARIDLDDPHDKALVDDGALVKAETADAETGKEKKAR